MSAVLRRRQSAEPVQGPCGHWYRLTEHRECPQCRGVPPTPAKRTRQVRRAKPRAKPTCPPGWVETQEAWAILGCQCRALRKLEHRKRPGPSAGCRPFIYRLADIERVARVHRACPHVTMIGAVEVVAGLNANRF